MALPRRAALFAGAALRRGSPRFQSAAAVVPTPVEPPSDTPQPKSPTKIAAAALAILLLPPALLAYFCSDPRDPRLLRWLNTNAPTVLAGLRAVVDLPYVQSPAYRACTHPSDDAPPGDEGVLPPDHPPPPAQFVAGAIPAPLRETGLLSLHTRSTLSASAASARGVADAAAAEAVTARGDPTRPGLAQLAAARATAAEHRAGVLAARLSSWRDGGVRTWLEPDDAPARVWLATRAHHAWAAGEGEAALNAAFKKAGKERFPAPPPVTLASFLGWGATPPPPTPPTPATT